MTTQTIYLVLGILMASSGVTRACLCSYCNDFVLKVKVLDETKVLNFVEDTLGSMFTDQATNYLYSVELDIIYR